MRLRSSKRVWESVRWIAIGLIASLVGIEASPPYVVGSLDYPLLGHYQGSGRSSAIR